MSFKIERLPPDREHQHLPFLCSYCSMTTDWLKCPHPKDLLCPPDDDDGSGRSAFSSSGLEGRARGLEAGDQLGEGWGPEMSGVSEDAEGRGR